MTTLVWFRSDLRLHDNPALHQACQQLGAVSAVYIATPGQWRNYHWGDNKTGFIGAHLTTLRRDLNQLSIPLHILCCDDYQQVPETLFAFSRTLDATSVVCNQEPGVDEQQRDHAARHLLATAAIGWQRFEETNLVPHDQIRNGQGLPYRVFTPYMKQVRRWLVDHPPHPLPIPQPRQQTPQQPLSQQPLLQQVDQWLTKPSYQLQWHAGEKAAWKQLQRFSQETISQYHHDRDIPAVIGTSKLSPYLAIGAISVNAIYHYINRTIAADDGTQTWVNELIWRDFYRYLMHHFPKLSKGQAMYANKEPVWKHDPNAYQRWQQGQTGFPMVDAGMRELLKTGWMHNRLRMLCASFLVKDLHIDWRQGEAHFMNHLIDGDFASNNGGWQWAAGCGADAAPYFRHFSPTRQAQRFDPDKRYQQRYISDLTSNEYPDEMVDHRQQCQRFSAKIKELSDA